jgi:hypothetical protein
MDRYTKVGNYYVRRPMAHPVHDPWTAHARDAAEALAGVLVLFVLMFVLPALLFLVLS